MVGYVTEEVDRVKLLFKEREARLVGERDRAQQDCMEASNKWKGLEKSLDDAQTMTAVLSLQIKVLSRDQMT